MVFLGVLGEQVFGVAGGMKCADFGFLGARGVERFLYYGGLWSRGQVGLLVL